MEAGNGAPLLTFELWGESLPEEVCRVGDGE